MRYKVSRRPVDRRIKFTPDDEGSFIVEWAKVVLGSRPTSGSGTAIKAWQTERRVLVELAVSVVVYALVYAVRGLLNWELSVVCTAAVILWAVVSIVRPNLRVILVDIRPVHGYRRLVILLLLGYVTLGFYCATTYSLWSSEFTKSPLGPILGPIRASFATLTGFGSPGMCATTFAAELIEWVQSIIGFVMTGLTLASLLGYLSRRRSMDRREHLP